MREILYFQAGSVSNYVGTHFWNAQESYFTYGEDAVESIVDHDISFREGITENGEPTFCPRLLLFDRKANLGSLSDLYGESADEDAEGLLAQWNGSVVEYRQDRVPKSEYHTRLDATETNDTTKHQEANLVVEPHADDSTIRFWSDYNRVFFHPRTIQRLPDLPNPEAAQGDWEMGREEFGRLEEDLDIMEDSFRPFVEECDNLQGVQIMNDTSTFGSFTHSFLTRFRDEFVKLPSFSFPILSGVDPRVADVDDSRSLMMAVNDALSLRGFNELSTTTVPIQHPSTWTSGDWLCGLNANLKNVYHTSAILATHVESATLPMRLRSPTSSTDMSSLCSLLNWRVNTKFSCMSGAFPLTSNILKFEPEVVPRVHDFSCITETPRPAQSRSVPFARVDVSRGLPVAGVTSYSEWADQFRPQPLSVHVMPCPIPTSYPRIFQPPAPAVGGFSSLTTSPSSSSLFAMYATFVAVCESRHTDVTTRLGLEQDDVRDLKEELWALEDAYRSEDGSIDDMVINED